MNADLDLLSGRWIAALLTGGVQGLALVLGAWLTLKCLTRINAATRHAVWFAILVIISALPVVQFHRSAPAATTEAAESLQATTAPLASNESFIFEESSDIKPAIEASVTDRQESVPNGDTPDFVATATTPAEFSLSLPGRSASIVLGGIALLSTLRLVGLLRQIRILRRYKFRSVPAAQPIKAIFETLKVRLGLNRQTRLLISEEIPAPMVVGYLHPAVLLPTSIAEDSNAEQLTQILCHELAHVGRHDDWANLIQQLIAAIFFFHPAVRLVSRRMTAEREIACDDHALDGGRSPRDYALLLTEFASRMKGRDFTAAPAAWSKQSQLKERISMILNEKRNASPRASRAGVGLMTLAAFGLALGALAALPRITMAEPAAAAQDVAEPADPAFRESGEISQQPVPNADGLRRGTPSGQGSADQDPSAPLDKPQPVSPSRHPTPPPVPAIPAPEAVLHGHSTITLHPAPAPHPAPEPSISVNDGPEQPRQPRSRNPKVEGDLERRLERIERTLDSLVNSSKRRIDLLAPEIAAKIQMETDRARQELERAARNLADSTRKRDLRDVHLEMADEHMKLAVGRDSLKARHKQLEMRHREIEREMADLEREMEKAEQSREQLAEQRERDREKKRAEKAEKERTENKNRDEGGKPDTAERR